MKKKYFSLFLIVISLSACKKEKIAPIVPSVNFGLTHVVDIYNRYELDTSALIKIATYDRLPLSNLTKNSNSIKWDLGDGTSSTKDSPEIYFTKAGEYTVSLTATSTTGETVTRSKKIQVLDRVLKLVRIKNLYFNANFTTSPNWSPDQIADVQVAIKKINMKDYPAYSNGDFGGETVYQSAAFSTVSAINQPIEIPVKEKVILDIEALEARKYGFHLYATANHAKYLLTSNWGSGVGISTYGNIISNSFNLTSGFNGNAIEFVFAFE